MQASEEASAAIVPLPSWLSDSVTVGHTTLHEAQTGITVLRFSRALPLVAHQMGSAPATREFAAATLGGLVARVHSLVLSGGSAFGLDATAGVVAALAAEGLGVALPSLPGKVVPVVPAASIFDLDCGTATWPSAADAAAAFAAATATPAVGRVGAGTGAAVGRMGAAMGLVPQRGGFGVGESPCGLAVAAAVVNAVGQIVADNGAVIASATPPAGGPPVDLRAAFFSAPPLPVAGAEAEGGRGATILVSVFVRAPPGAGVLARESLLAVARGVTAAMGRAVWPACTLYDGDVVFVVDASPPAEGAAAAPAAPDVAMRVAIAAAEAVIAAIRRAVGGGV